MASFRSRRACAKKQPVIDDDDDDGDDDLTSLERDFNFRKTTATEAMKNHTKQIGKPSRIEKIVSSDENDNIVDEENLVDKQLREAGISVWELNHMTMENKRQLLTATQESKEHFRRESENVKLMKVLKQDGRSKIDHYSMCTDEHSKLPVSNDCLCSPRHEGIQGIMINRGSKHGTNLFNSQYDKHGSNSLNSQYKSGSVVPLRSLHQGKNTSSLLMHAASKSTVAPRRKNVPVLMNTFADVQSQVIKPSNKNELSMLSPVLSSEEEEKDDEIFPTGNGSSGIGQKLTTTSVSICEYIPKFTVGVEGQPDVVLQRNYVHNICDHYSYSTSSFNNKEDYQKVMLSKLTEWSRLHAELITSSPELKNNEEALKSSKWYKLRFVKQQLPSDVCESESYGEGEVMSRPLSHLKSSTKDQSIYLHQKEEAHHKQGINEMPTLRIVGIPSRSSQQSDISHTRTQSFVDHSLPDLSSVFRIVETRGTNSVDHELASDNLTKQTSPPSSFSVGDSNANAGPNSHGRIVREKSTAKLPVRQPTKRGTQPKKDQSKPGVPTKKKNQKQCHENALLNFSPRPVAKGIGNKILLSKGVSPSAYSDMFSSAFDFPSIDEEDPLGHPGYSHLNRGYQPTLASKRAELLFDECTQQSRVSKTAHNNNSVHESLTFQSVDLLLCSKTYCKRKGTAPKLSLKKAKVKKIVTELDTSSEDGEEELFNAS